MGYCIVEAVGLFLDGNGLKGCVNIYPELNCLDLMRSHSFDGDVMHGL